MARPVDPVLVVSIVRAESTLDSRCTIPAYQAKVLTLHPFLLMRFPSTTPVVHVELAAGAFYVHGKDVAPYESILQRLDRVALSPGDTRTIITGLMEEV